MNLNIYNIIKDLFVYSPEAPILYTRPIFWILFAAIMGLYSIFYKKNPIRNFYLLAISFFLYYKTNGAFLGLLIFSSMFNYLCGILIEKGKTIFAKKGWLMVALSINLFILAYFKYAYFFSESFNQIFSTNHKIINYLVLWENQVLGSSFDASVILLPVGISFYTFQAISYLVDIYKNRVTAVRNIVDFSFYLSFFPQLVAGPIVRASAFIPQLYEKYKLTKAEFGHAVFLVLKGLVKKIVFADFIATNFVDRVFASPSLYTGVENILAVYGYSLQIYADFSGYTDIAIGLALFMGFKLPINFNEPYKSYSLTNFWRRWHISLSLWLRDYLYIPLGGNRKSKLRTYLNVFITMALGGLWHGAHLRFIVWGTIHGAGLLFDKILFSITKTHSLNSRVLRIISTIFTFHIVTFAWIFFRAESWETINQLFYQVKHNLNLQVFPEIIQGYAIPFIIMFIGFILIWTPSGLKEKLRGLFIKSPIFVKFIITTITILLLYQATSSELQAFIYFSF